MRVVSVRIFPAIRLFFAATCLLAVPFTAIGPTTAAALVIDFEQLLPGTVLDSSRLDPGFTIAVTNGNPAHPNAAIVFDSSCEAGCTGEDPDLRTPGQGIGNTLGQGRVLIIAEDDVDLDPADGRVDDPDDEIAGGTIAIGFPEPLGVESLRVIDIDLNETTGFVELTLAGGGTTAQPLVALGNNSGQTVTFPDAPLATAIMVFLQGSGAIDDIVITDTGEGGGGGGGETCGDGVVDAGEECDDGAANSDVTPDACREDCTLPLCGDGVVDTGEQCEPPATPTCDAGCHTTGGGEGECPTQVEVCNDFVDNDGDGLIDCRDTLDCPLNARPPCGCEGVRRDPAIIRFDTKHGADYLSVHGNFRVHTDVDFASDRVAVMLSNANGMIWRGMLVEGELKRRQGGKGQYFFKDRHARGGIAGDSDNFYRVGVRVRGNGERRACHFRIKAYGDFSAATDALMTFQIAVGDDVGAATTAWRPTKRGWILHQRDFDDVPD